MSQPRIEKNVPMPLRYPFAQMEVGDSFAVPPNVSLIGVNNARFVWQQAFEVCAQIAEKAEPYQAADLIRARAARLLDDWEPK